MRAIAPVPSALLLAAPVAPLLAQAAQQAPVKESTLIQALLLAGLIVFIAAVWATGFTAKKINNISNPSYGKAFVAQVLIYFAFPATLGMFLLLFKAPLPVALGVPYVVLPIAIYKVVFGSMWREAALIWLVVTVVVVGVAYLLTLVGLLSLASVMGTGG